MSILGGTPTTLREYSEQFVEGLLLIFYNRFGFNTDAIPAAVCTVLARLAEDTSGLDLSKSPPCRAPLALAIEVADSRQARVILLDGTPLTEERVEGLAYELAMVSIISGLTKCGSCTKCNQ